MDPNDVHKITRGEMEHIFKYLKYIDAAREALKGKGTGNEAIVTELQKERRWYLRHREETPAGGLTRRGETYSGLISPNDEYAEEVVVDLTSEKIA